MRACVFRSILLAGLLSNGLVLAQLTAAEGAAEGQAAAPPASPLAAPPPTPEPPSNLAPLPKGTPNLVMHAAYELDLEDCSTCHKNADPKNPGELLKDNNELCLECHEDYRQVLARKHVHTVAELDCCMCHNPHNSKEPKLLLEERGTLCLTCHEEIQKLVAEAKVTHDALSVDRKCLNCHNPHASDVEHLLTALPFDLCIQCHDKDNVKDQDGKKLTNFKKLLEDNPEWHAPVAAKDCSACHNPHGSDHFRLARTHYPPNFYSPYDPAMYALCFECHNADILAEPETTTLTQFRNGSTNLHYLHVNKPTRGRTCRACHEVHAAKQAHQIRDGVPYGSKGWILQLNYTRTETGGSCDRTCHSKREYNYLLPAASRPATTPSSPAQPSSTAPAAAPPPASPPAPGAAQ